MKSPRPVFAGQRLEINEYRLLPLYESKVRAFPCRLVFYTENERGDTRRYSTAQK